MSPLGPGIFWTMESPQFEQQVPEGEMIGSAISSFTDTALRIKFNINMAFRKPLQEKPPEAIYDYGCKVKGKPQFFYDKAAFAFRWPIDRGCPTRVQLFRRISDKILPGHFEWHEWTQKQMEALCEYKWCGLSGCSNSAKTRNVISFACVWWLVDPDISSVTLVSTSLKSLRKRGWAEVQNIHTAIPGPRFGNFVDSKMIWQCRKGDDKHAIIGKAVEEGSVHKVADDIKGVHTRRQMVIIDEATAVPEAIFDACTNLFSYPEEFILIVIGNPRNRLDQMGKFCEPKDGWTSVSVEDEEWETKPQLDGKTGIVVRFDAEKSPNIKEGKIISKHLPTKEKVDAVKKEHGQSPWYWSNFRGFWPPEGLSKTVFSESAIIQNDGFGKHEFSGRNFRIIGTFDPAFGGGDRPTLRFAKLGELISGKWGIQAFPPIVVPIKATSSNPVHFQLAETVRRYCEGYKFGDAEPIVCLPENLGFDATGEGGGLCDIVQRTWSSQIIRIEFGGRASEDYVSLEDSRPACDVFENKTVEMWIRSRDALNHGQFKGIDKETAVELCNREFDDSGKRIKLQKKVDYKSRFGKSPDYADSFVMLREVARIKGFRLTPLGETQKRVEGWDEQVVKTQSVFETSDYSDDEAYDLEPA